MLALPRHNRFSVSSVVSLAVSISAAGAVAVSVADEPKPDAATLQATEKDALRGVLTREQQAAYTPQKVLDTLRLRISQKVCDPAVLVRTQKLFDEVFSKEAVTTG